MFLNKVIFMTQRYLKMSQVVRFSLILNLPMNFMDRNSDSFIFKEFSVRCTPDGRSNVPLMVDQMSP